MSYRGVTVNGVPAVSVINGLTEKLLVLAGAITDIAAVLIIIAPPGTRIGSTTGVGVKASIVH